MLSVNVLDVVEMQVGVFIVGKNEFEYILSKKSLVWWSTSEFRMFGCNHPLVLLLFSQLRVSQEVDR